VKQPSDFTSSFKIPCSTFDILFSLHHTVFHVRHSLFNYFVSSLKDDPQISIELMKAIKYFLFLILINFSVAAQVPSIQWQQCYGGTSSDEIYSTGKIIQTADDGYIMAGYTYSNDGDVNGNHGG